MLLKKESFSGDMGCKLMRIEAPKKICAMCSHFAPSMLRCCESEIACYRENFWRKKYKYIPKNKNYLDFISRSK